MNADLVSAICSRAVGLSPANARSLRQLLGNVLIGLDGPKGLPADPLRRAAVQTALAALFRLRNFDNEVPPDGILWKGRPDFIDDQAVLRLQKCAESAHASREPTNGHHFVEQHNALDLLPTEKLRSFFLERADGLFPAGRANFQYYDTEGDKLDPHVDVDRFTANALMLVRHEHAGEPQSAFWILPPDGNPRQIPLNVGEVVVFFASVIAHQRTAVGPNERVTTMSVGLVPPTAGPNTESSRSPLTHENDP